MEYVIDEILSMSYVDINTGEVIWSTDPAEVGTYRDLPITTTEETGGE